MFRYKIDHTKKFDLKFTGWDSNLDQRVRLYPC